MSSMWPRGVTCYQDVPHDLLAALSHANRIIGWQEDLPTSEDIPPEWMWALPWELVKWFHKIRAKYKAKSGSDDDDGDDPTVDYDEASDEDVEAWLKEMQGL